MYVSPKLLLSIPPYPPTSPHLLYAEPITCLSNHVDCNSVVVIANALTNAIDFLNNPTVCVETRRLFYKLNLHLA